MPGDLGRFFALQEEVKGPDTVGHSRVDILLLTPGRNQKASFPQFVDISADGP